METKRLDQDTQLKTISGATFSAEKGWFVSQKNGVITLEEPDHGLTVTLVENQENSAEEAVTAAWKLMQQNFEYVIQHIMKEAPRDGWDEIVQFMYTASVSAKETEKKPFIFAIARRVGPTWYIELINGTKAAFDRRMAGVLLIDTSFKVPGVAEESFAHKKIHTLSAAELQEFMAFVEQARTRCEIPGVSLGIVQDGKVIWEQGFGVRALGKPEKVTPETLFMIGSTTKALTSFMMARLVEEGEFTWETPVTQIMPDFALGDAATTKQVLMKYMVSASTGIPRQDIETLFNYDHATPELRIKEMRNMKPTTGFGETFQYSNAMVSAGGYIAAHSVDKKVELGKAYDAAMQSRVFDPLDMNSTTFDFSQLEQTNHAIPHGFRVAGTYLSLEIADEKWVESIRPAGGAWSNVHDMAQYMIMELHNGVTAEGKRVISEDNLLKRREPQIKVTDKISYGLGLMMENNYGVLSVGHDGATMGFSSLMFFLPGYDTGIVVLTNARGASVFMQAVKRKFMEMLFDGKPQAQEMLTIGIDQQKTMFKKSLDDIVLKPDGEWLQQFFGTYEHPVLGKIVIRQVADGAELDAHLWRGSLGQKREKNGSLKLILTDGSFAGLEFSPQQHDGIMQLKLESGQHTYVFERK